MVVLKIGFLVAFFASTQIVAEEPQSLYGSIYAQCLKQKHSEYVAKQCARFEPGAPFSCSISAESASAALNAEFAASCRESAATRHGAFTENISIISTCSPLTGCQQGSSAAGSAEASGGATTRPVGRPGATGPGTGADDESLAAGAAEPARVQQRSSEAVRAEIQRDLQACSNAQKRASKCCENPMSCTTGSIAKTGVPGAGMLDACLQSQQRGADTADLGAKAAAVCSSGHYACTTGCSSLLGKYQQLAQECAGCVEQSRYDSVVQALSTISRTCEGLKSKEIQWASGALEGAKGSSISQAICNSIATAATSSSSKQNNDNYDPYGCASDPTSPVCQQQCVLNPQAPGCGSGEGYAIAEQSTGGFGGGDSSTSDLSNPVDYGPIGGTDFPMEAPQAAAGGGAQGAAVVANNSGGAIPGGAGGGAASLDGRGGRAGAGGGAGKSSVTDIMQGERGGSGYSGNSGGSGLEFESEDEGAGGNGRGNLRGGSAMVGLQGMDLKAFLPGGSRGPAMARLGGLCPTCSRQQHGQGVNLFHVVSRKMQEACKLGRIACPP